MTCFCETLNRPPEAGHRCFDLPKGTTIQRCQQCGRFGVFAGVEELTMHLAVHAFPPMERPVPNLPKVVGWAI